MLVTGIQSSLYAYISALMAGDESARDVLQETNLVLWEKESAYDRSCSFSSWAFQIAQFQVLAFRKRQKRSRLVFDDDLIGLLAEDFHAEVDRVDARVEALQGCLKKLDSNQRKLVARRYEQNHRVSDIADSLERTPNAVSLMLHRVRQFLLDCVERNVRMEAAK